MSQVSPISDSSKPLYLLLQSLRAEQQSNSATASPAPAASSTAATTPTTGTTPTSSAEAAAGQVVQGAHPHHGHGKGAMFKKLAEAVTSALQAAQSDPTADPNKVIEDAIAKVFKENGAPPMPPNGAAPPAGGPVKDGDNDDAQQASGQSGQASQSPRQVFMQLLSSFGVSADQFQQDFLAAIKDAQSGQADTSGGTSAALKSFTPGTLVNATA